VHSRKELFNFSADFFFHDCVRVSSVKHRVRPEIFYAT
jgi:hypothetical protein